MLCGTSEEEIVMYQIEIDVKGHNTQHSGHMGQNFETELMVEIYSKSLVRAMVKYYS